MTSKDEERLISTLPDFTEVMVPSQQQNMAPPTHLTCVLSCFMHPRKAQYPFLPMQQFAIFFTIRPLPCLPTNRGPTVCQRKQKAPAGQYHSAPGQLFPLPSISWVPRAPRGDGRAGLLAAARRRHCGHHLTSPLGPDLWVK